MLRSIPSVALATTLVAAAAPDAAAVDLQGGSLSIELRKPDGDGTFSTMSATDVAEFFNASHCICGTPFAVRLQLSGQSGRLDSVPVEVWVGNACDDTENLADRDQRCTQIATVSDINDLQTPQTIPIPVAELVSPGITQGGVLPPPYACPATEATRNVFVLVDDNGDNEYENVFTLADDLFVDAVAPPEPTEVQASAGENGAQVTWKLPQSNTDDLRSFQILCARTDGTVSDDDGFPRADADYQTPLTECPELFATAAPLPGGRARGGGDGGPVDAGAVDAGADAGPPPAGLDVLDPMFVCSDPIGSTSSTARVDGLENGVEYELVLVTVDPRRNPAVTALGRITPSEVIDFWEDYKGQGGAALGEYCFVATATYGDYDHPFVRVLRNFRDDVLAPTSFGRRLIEAYYAHSPPAARFIARHPALRALAWVALLPVVLAAGAWVYTGWAGKLGLLVAFALWRALRRRRRPAPVAAARGARARTRRAAAAAAVAALVALWAGRAAAQPYWDEPGGPADQQLDDTLRERRSAWTLEIKFGPYLPEVDSEPAFAAKAADERPFARMFGNRSRVMTQVELDRYLLYPKGQLGIGAGIGFWDATAHAFEVDADGTIVADNNGDPKRSPGDETSLQILPVYVHAIYRLTLLDDELGVPIVPYAKVGLSWYLWRITRPDGDTATYFPDDTCTTAGDCPSEKARGATTGYQGAVGISVRAERLDPSAARALASDMGIEHAGFFVELALAKVNGITSDNLRVGDTTWLAGINFEF